ncbi:hypothetical protein CC80DRAFT_464258 [Byssothecium circinans]|uniref:Cytosolic endo-beta-N-acetylglucosaminidase TIM barrel domain-containing protein n=1 Tax=Byssothecium circinans TaxID=147558 RepID=A0A6A5UJX9_9PLEO|nr:hypothetical protein CC80DRAFT_464258 [Byssothecium circinans]
MASMLGWKDIVRPIRDGYRHLFPSPDTGPTPEERARQRELDRLKGFTYFDTFVQLESWTVSDSDPIQRANTPLLPRPSTTHEKGEQKPSILLCHDYSGNYHDYESVQQLGVDEESYTCDYLQYVDTFIYFSHKLVCIPPPSWTNTLHRNGVLSLGTLLIEPQTKDVDRLLLQTMTKGSKEDVAHFPTAKKLADIAVHYGFDGWLVNIEKPFSMQSWNPCALESFLSQLRDDLGPSRGLIWYDALTAGNKVAYQNALSSSNVSFSRACGHLLTNYSWKESDAIHSKHLASQDEHLIPQNIFFGIDVWAQNKAPFTRRRLTYPEEGGGGTNVAVAVARLADLELSAGVFAPAWTFEHFSGGDSRVLEQVVWEGAPLPDNITCSCGDPQIQHRPNRGRGITRYAKQSPAGSESFFYTDFSRGFGGHTQAEAERLYEGKSKHSQLFSQSILPNILRSSVTDRVEGGVNVLSRSFEHLVGGAQLVVETHSLIPEGGATDFIYERWLPLFKLDMPADGSLQLSIRFNNLLQASDATTRFYLKFSDCYQFLSCDAKRIPDHPILKNGKGDHERLHEIGVHFQAPHLGEESCRVLEVQEICILPHLHNTVGQDLTIDDVCIAKLGEGESEHQRLYWRYYDEEKSGSPRSGVPSSDITGPFSHFLIKIDGLEIGRAYALEHVLPKMEDLEEGDVAVEIIGLGFDGRQLARIAKQVRVR